MHFSVKYTGGNCSRCTWIQADGEIQSDTSEQFLVFLKDSGTSGGKITFNSNGGNLVGAMTLGRVLKALNFTTSVGNSHYLDDVVTTCGIEPGVCASACVLAFSGGSTRLLNTWDSEGRLLVHQFSLTEDHLNFSPPDMLSTGQLGSALVTSYFVQMGIDPAIMTASASASPMSAYEIGYGEATLLGLVTSDAFDPIKLTFLKSQPVFAASRGAHQIAFACEHSSLGVLWGLPRSYLSASDISRADVVSLLIRYGTRETSVPAHRGFSEKDTTYIQFLLNGDLVTFLTTGATTNRLNPTVTQSTGTGQPVLNAQPQLSTDGPRALVSGIPRVEGSTDRNFSDKIELLFANCARAER